MTELVSLRGDARHWCSQPQPPLPSQFPCGDDRIRSLLRRNRIRSSFKFFFREHADVYDLDFKIQVLPGEFVVQVHGDFVAFTPLRSGTAPFWRFRVERHTGLHRAFALEDVRRGIREDHRFVAFAVAFGGITLTLNISPGSWPSPFQAGTIIP